ncbi:condensation domain-containing protein [Streptomyces chilikensis]|uniref:condensation domain-containing protein n=1 Tax=Streptomyces chilikensis TaxID=1194079 RepID=UPI001409D60F|nr:condensation domain-containing protein [Streptomyces chilikensis]
MTDELSTSPASVVTVAPGPSPDGHAPVLELFGAPHEERVAAALDDEPDRTRHTLRRLGADHYLLTPDPAHAFPAGRVADLLTMPGRPAVAPGPGQRALLRLYGTGHRVPPLSGTLNLAGPVAGEDVAAALRGLAEAHPLLASRVGDGPAAGVRPVAPADAVDCTVAEVSRARERQAVAEAGRRLDARAGRTLHAVVLRGGRRIVLLADPLVADHASVRVLVADLAEALADAAAHPAPEEVRYSDWTGSLPDVASDPRETGHWQTVAEGRAAAHPFRPRRTLRDAQEAAHRPALVLGRAATRRVTVTLARRLGLTASQVLAGAAGLALARWRNEDRASFDVHTDGRQDSPALRRTVGPLAVTEPVLLEGAADGDGPDFLARAAGRLAVVGRASFAACREHAPSPALRLVLRELVPALMRFTPDADAAPPPADGSHLLDLTARTRGGRLRWELRWTPSPLDAVDEESADRFVAVLRDTLEELARGADRPADGIRVIEASPLQRELLADADAHPGTGRQIEQLSWIWHGPLEQERFAAAWRSVFDREAVLRASFGGGSDVQVLIHEHVAPEVVRAASGDLAWSDLLAADRRRGIDPRAPGPLRVTLVQDPEATPSQPATRVLVTYHQALLDAWSVRLLVEQFCLAYLADGSLPGGDRRPDVRDHARWLAGQDTAPAKDFWRRSAPAAGAGTRVVALPGDGAVASPARWQGPGRVRARIAPGEAARLAAWAARLGATESSAVQAAWAILLHHTSGAVRRGPVRYSVALSGRGIALDGVERLPGALRNPVPVAVEVDPAGTVPELLVALRDQALDLASYEWVSAGQIRAWAHAPDGLASPDGPGGAPGRPTVPDQDAGSLLVFDSRINPFERLEPSFAALGVRMEFPWTTGARTAFSLTLVSHRDEGGGLVLTAEHDRGRLPDVSGVLSHCVRLLRSFPSDADGSTPIARLLELLPGTSASGPPFVTLRPGTGRVIGLVPSPGAPLSWYVRLAQLYTGPEELVLLRSGDDQVRSWHEVLRVVAGDRLAALGTFSGGGEAAWELARLVGDHTGDQPAVVVAAASASSGTQALATRLGKAVRPADLSRPRHRRP